MQRNIMILILLMAHLSCYANKVIYMTKGSMYHILTDPGIQHLKNVLTSMGYDLQQADSTDNLKDFEFLIHTEIPKKHLPYPKEKLILFIQEPLTPNNHNPEYHKQFNKIITWYTDLIDNKRYFQYTIYRDADLSKVTLPTLAEKQKLCTFVNANKMYAHPHQLYTARIKTLEVFDQYPQDFDMYGPGWDKKKFKTFKGNAGHTYPEKIEYLKRYKFCICYENVTNMPGYVSEKIVHCLQAGCVPVYWGQPQVTDLIPENCFIARERFKSDKDLYLYLKNMPDKVYQQYLDNIQHYLRNDPRVYLLSPDHFVDVFLHVLFGKN